jgi:histidinol dehydrogenase
MAMAPNTLILADYEGFPAHAEALRYRMTTMEIKE